MRQNMGWMIVTLLAIGFCASVSSASIQLKDIDNDSPIVLSQNTDYKLENVSVTKVRDTAALTLAGRIKSVLIQNSRFGQVWAGPNGRAAAVEASGAAIGSFIATDTEFYNAEHQLAGMKDGSFGTVVFLRCTFRTSDEFLREIYANNPWRTWPPITEFHNIERLELLDNLFSNTLVIIHPSVKTVVIRGDMTNIFIQDAQTQVIHLDSDPQPSTTTPLTFWMHRLAGYASSLLA